MSDLTLTALLAGAVAQWITAAGSIWLTWWAAQSQDAVAVRGLAMLLVVLPALCWPLLTLSITSGMSGTVADRAFLFGVISGGVAVVRAILLAIWAALSRDAAYLRIVGGVVAGLQLVALAGVLLAGLAH